MRLCTYRADAATRLGRVEGDRVVPLDGRDLRDALSGVPAPAGEPVPLEGVDLVAPHVPATTFAVGRNYPLHAAEINSEVPPHPQVFMKHRGSITGPSGPVVHPGERYTRCLDYECELAVVIGRRAERVDEARALGHVFGYAVMNDVSARDVQRAEPQWLRAKGGPTFGPFGPWVTTADEVADPQALGQRTWVNGELRQDSTTGAMVFGVARVISWLSHSLALEPGDVIAMGTPAGVGLGMDPPRFLVPGDVVRMEIDGLGAIEHRVVARAGA
jgi:2-keto-4-pentenoate hydratase/2-oxohepta-3-ene-1,7-dioic acid hydratase in catechol pathway